MILYASSPRHLPTKSKPEINTSICQRIVRIIRLIEARNLPLKRVYLVILSTQRAVGLPQQGGPKKWATNSWP